VLECPVFTGIYTSGYDSGLNIRAGFPVFTTRIEANWVSKAADQYAIYKLTDEDTAEITRLGRDPAVGEST
jgi:DNA replication licensing factor MCM2